MSDASAAGGRGEPGDAPSDARPGQAPPGGTAGSAPGGPAPARGAGGGRSWAALLGDAAVLSSAAAATYAALVGRPSAPSPAGPGAGAARREGTARHGAHPGAHPGAGAPSSPVGSAAARADPNRLGHGAGADLRQRKTEHGERGPASKRIIVGYGFWVFLLSDIIMFSAFFAAYAVLAGETAGGPGGRDLFDLTNVGLETGLLLLSSFTCGLATLSATARRESWFYAAMAATFVLGVAFVALEAREFAGMVAEGAGPQRSAFLSAFFTLVGCHGLHVTAGLLWLLTMMAQVFFKGFRDDIQRRILCFGLFWHALDIVWVALFTVVYLMGAGL